jgi:hypothetical protein
MRMRLLTIPLLSPRERATLQQTQHRADRSAALVDHIPQHIHERVS